jgi:hypothetical protein
VHCRNLEAAIRCHVAGDPGGCGRGPVQDRICAHELAGKIQAPVAVIDETFPQYGIALANGQKTTLS